MIGEHYMQHLGFKYDPYTEDQGYLVPKPRHIWHDIIWPDNRTTVGPWPPDRYATKEEFESFVESLLEER